MTVAHFILRGSVSLIPPLTDDSADSEQAQQHTPESPRRLSKVTVAIKVSKYRQTTIMPAKDRSLTGANRTEHG